jgi:DNA-binding PadR family transcriptional regulator
MKETTDTPLSEATFLILLSLADMPRHGYAILKEVERLSDGRVVMSTGTLYGAIKRFLDGGWIRRVADPEGETSRDRQAYDLTREGHRIVSAEARRLETLARVSRARLKSREA